MTVATEMAHRAGAEPPPPPPPLPAARQPLAAGEAIPERAAAPVCGPAASKTSSTGLDSVVKLEEAVYAAGNGTAPPPRRRVVLRVEVATSTQARVLSWLMWALNILFVLTAAGLLSMRETDTRVGELWPYYVAQAIISGICLLLLVSMLLWFTVAVRRIRRERRTWTKRQAYFARTAAIVLLLQIPYSASFMASFTLVSLMANCSYPWKVLAVLEFVQWIFFASLMLFVLARLENMTRWRGKGALDMHPDYRLMVDRPAHEILRNHRIILTVWAVLIAGMLFALINKLMHYSEAAVVTFEGGCDAMLTDWSCGTSIAQTAIAVVSFVCVVVYTVVWIWWMRRALRDHEQLPYNRYRATNMFVRVLLRVVSPVLVAVVASMLFLTLIPSFRDSCWAAVDSSMGNLPVDMALTICTTVMVIFFMPKEKALDSPLLQEFLQGFSWTVEGLPAAINARNELLLETECPDTTEQLSRLQQKLHLLEDELQRGLARLIKVPDVQQVAEQLQTEPMFVLETAVKLFYWSRLAYRNDDALTHAFVNAPTALPLFCVNHFEMIWDEDSDTHCVLGWSDTQVVLAFRGTKSMQNVLTDLKTWMVPLQPRRKRQGRVVRVHAGFAGAWLNHGFNLKVLARLRELDCNEQPLRFFIAGHSLGGALAALAALDIQREHPRSQLTCYLYGCPRIGNAAFAAEYDAAVPDTWAIINGLDPIPWIPHDVLGYRRVGKQVTINLKGDLILRPTYFELSVTHQGTRARHHLTGGYAHALAAIVRAQFNASKALPCGPAGVAQLAAAVDLGRCLVLSNMDLASLRDPSRRPVLLEALAARKARGGAPSMRAASGRAAGAAAGCARLGCECLPFGPFSRRSAERRERDDVTADDGEQQAAVAEELEDGEDAARVPQDAAVAEDSRVQRGLQRAGVEAPGAADASGHSASLSLPKTRRANSLHTLRFPTFKLDASGLATLVQEADAADGAAVGGSDVQRQGLQLPRDPEQGEAVWTREVAAAAAAAAGAAGPLPARRSLGRPSVRHSGSVALAPECSMHSALSSPEQLPDVELSSDDDQG